MTFPLLFKHSRRKNRSVREALAEDTWISDLAHGNTDAILADFLALNRWLATTDIRMQDDQEDKIRWCFTADGAYTAASAYKAQFEGHIKTPFRQLVWSTWAPGRLRIFAWLLLKDRLWCNDRLQRRGWPNHYFCQCCLRNLESSYHLFWQCPMSTAIWRRAAQWVGCQGYAEQNWRHKSQPSDILTAMINAVQPKLRQPLKTVTLLILWKIWQERNECTFRAKTASINDVVVAVRRDFALWRQSGVKFIEPPFGDEAVRI